MLNLHQLHLFVTIVQEKSFSAAAKKLHLSQPAVSSQLKTLEDNLGIQLIDRQSRQLELTSGGFIVYEEAQQILSLASELIQKAKRYSAECEEQILLGASTLVADFPLPCALYAFKEQYPEYCIKVHRDTCNVIYDRMLKKEIELALLEGAVPYPGLENYAYGPDELIVAVPAKHYLAEEKKYLRHHDLKDAVILTREEHSGLRQATDHYLKQLDIQISDFDKTLELNSIAAIRSSLEAGKGISILPRSVLRQEIRTKTIKVLPLEDLKMPLYYYLLTHSNTKITPAVKLLRAFLASPEQRVFC